MASGSFADFRSIKTMNYFCATGEYFYRNYDCMINITQIHKTSQISSEYVPKYNLTFPKKQKIHVFMNFGHKISQELP